MKKSHILTDSRVFKIISTMLVLAIISFMGGCRTCKDLNTSSTCEDLNTEGYEGYSVTVGNEIALGEDPYGIVFYDDSNERWIGLRNVIFTRKNDNQTLVNFGYTQYCGEGEIPKWRLICINRVGERIYDGTISAPETPKPHFVSGHQFNLFLNVEVTLDLDIDLIDKFFIVDIGKKSR